MIQRRGFLATILGLLLGKTKKPDPKPLNDLINKFGPAVDYSSVPVLPGKVVGPRKIYRIPINKTAERVYYVECVLVRNISGQELKPGRGVT